MLKISSVSKYKGETYMIEFDEGEPGFLNREIVSKYNLKAGISLPLSAWEDIVFENDVRRARERALYLLDYRDYSYIDMYHKLEKNYSEYVCFAVMDKLVEIGVINDRRYAESLAQQYMEGRKYGYYKAVQQMKLKNLTKELIEAALEPYKEDTYERLYELIEQKYLRYLGDEKGVAKVKNALARQGYSYGDIKQAVNDILEEYGED